MPEWLSQFIANVLDPIGIVLGIVMAVPVFWTWYQVLWGEQRRRRKLFRDISSNPGQRPTILVLDLLPGRDTRHQVENFRRQHETLKDVPHESIITINRSAHLQPDDMPELQRELRDAANALMQAGTDRVHVFIAAPVAAAAMLGAEFANMPTTIYQYDRNTGTYVNFGMLRMS